MKRLLFILTIFCAPLFIHAYTSPGSPSGFVNDFSGIFSAEQKAQMEGLLQQFEKETSNEISVVTITSLGGDTIENYAVKLFEEWKIGKSKEDNGILILISRDDREVRIEVGYGLEGALPDALTSSMIRNTIVPAFKQGDYYGGTLGTLNDIVLATRGEYQATPENSKSFPKIPFELIIFLLFIVPTWLASIFGRSKSWWAGGVFGGLIGVILSFVFGLFYIGILSIAVLIPLGLLFDYIVSKAYGKAVSTGSHMPWWIGGGKGGGFGGGGFGGFGGGFSGGGGSSGRW